MILGSVVIERRFLGPPNSANGGYACGRIAAYVEGDSAEVTLRRPPPLDTILTVRAKARGAVALYDGDVLIGSGHAAPVSIAAMDAPSFEQADAAAERTFDASRHPLPSCFVCGPHRAPGDGLRIHVGPLDPDDRDWHGPLAATWTPDASLAGDRGIVRPEFVWAALDCPTAYASSSALGMRTILLGRQAVRILRLPAAGERCVVAAREIAEEGRKYFAQAALFDEGGETLAECRATWIEVTPEVQRGAGAESS